MSLSCKETYDVIFHVYIPTELLNVYVRKSNLFTKEFNIIKMGKNMQHKDPPNMQLQTANSGGINKIFHALNRRHRWQNVRKTLPDKRKGSGKHIIDGETIEHAATTSQARQLQGNHKKNKSEIEHSGTEAGPLTSKASKKFRIRSLISDEMIKRRKKTSPRRRSPSPTRSPSKRNDKTPTKVTQNNCESPSTMKKRKCNICAAMLTVSYLRQKAQAYEHQKSLEDRDQNQQRIRKSSDGHKKGLTKSFSFPILRGLTKRKDSEIEELKSNLRACKDKETTKEKFILPMNQWKDDTLFPKPMLTRPASFKSPSSRSQKENNQTTNQSKTLRQKIGRVMKENKECRDSRESRKKEKRRILMDAVFHKIPYGRRNSKDPKKVSPDKIKSNSTTSSTGSHRMAVVDNANLKKNASTGEAMSKYRKLLSQTSVREDKGHLNDHKPRLCVAGDVSSGTNERKTLKNIHSLPAISPSDFTQNQEFPVKTEMETQQSIVNAIVDDQKSLDHYAFTAKLNVPTPAIQNLVEETKLVDKHGTVGKNSGVGLSTSDHQEKNDPQKEYSSAIENSTKQTKLHEEDEGVDAALSTSDHLEKINDQKESSAAIENEVKETKLVDKDEDVDEKLVMGLNSSDLHEKIDHKKESSAAEETELVDKDDEDVKENLGVSLNTSDHQEDIDNQMGSSAANESETNETSLIEKDELAIEDNLDASLNSSDHEEKTDNPKETTKESPEIEVEQDKSFNEILGMFKTVEQKKLDEESEPTELKLVIKGTTDDKDQGFDKDVEVCENSLDHDQENESSPLTSGPEVEDLMQDSILESPSLIDIPQSPLEEFSDENQQYLFSIDDQPSTSDQPSIHNKRPNIEKPMAISAKSRVNDKMQRNGFLHLDLNSVKDNTEFQFVKEVMERSGFLDNEVLGEWYSSYQPIDPLLFEEVEATFLQTNNLEELDSMKDGEAAQKIINDHHLLLFDLINESLLEIHNKTCTFCPNALIYGSKVRPMPVGYRVLEEVWDIVNMYLSWRQDLQPSLDDAVLSRDLQKGDGWMNLQADAEFVGIELEEMIADDLLDELVFDDLLM
ncbi:unnamed protein product [Lactuca virosa]|uniref:DUF4378 domain-containing protein n=1 Tax=Lactuca virosa TaxID=75947 RepID=A0AAU9MGZ4_9ASTR|nr:unnamed protein product [Lactuca virosa]